MNFILVGGIIAVTGFVGAIIVAFVCGATLIVGILTTRKVVCDPKSC